MRVRFVSRKSFGAFGSTSPVTGGDCPVESGGSFFNTKPWDRWCDCMYPANKDAANNFRCRHNSLAIWCIPAAPWTDVGSGCRGLPHEGFIAPIIENVLSIAGNTLNTFAPGAGGVLVPAIAPGGSSSTAGSGTPDVIPVVPMPPATSVVSVGPSVAPSQVQGATAKATASNNFVPLAIGGALLFGVLAVALSRR